MKSSGASKVTPESRSALKHWLKHMESGDLRAKLIVNPLSANGSTGRLWNQLRGAIEVHVGKADFAFTTSANHATTLARQALHEGFDLIVAVGGDGTLNEVVNGFFEGGSLINPNAALAVIPRGTGCDFVKTAGISKDTSEAARIMCGKTIKKCDVGHLTCADGNGGNIERYFINIADFGIGGETVERVNTTTKAFGGFLSFFYGAVSTLLTYKSKEVHIRVDETYQGETLINNVVVANGQYFGGGMQVAPHAILDDGWFDILIIEHMGRIESLANITKLYKGAHLGHPKIKFMRGKSLFAESSERVLLDVEGEQVGMLPVRFDLIPAAINVKVGG